jgi:hypothetical protein
MRISHGFSGNINLDQWFDRLTMSGWVALRMKEEP